MMGGRRTIFFFVIPGRTEGADPDPGALDSGFAASRRPGMTVKAIAEV